MADPILILASEVALTISLTVLIFGVRRYAAVPQRLASVGWHGGKKKR